MRLSFVPLVSVLLAVPAASVAQGYVHPFTPERQPPGLEFLALPIVNQVPPPNRWVPGSLSCGGAMMNIYVAKLHEYEARIRDAAGYQEKLRLLEEERGYIERYQQKLKTPVYGWAPYQFGMLPADPACPL